LGAMVDGYGCLTRTDIAAACSLGAMVECLEVGMKLRAKYGDEFYSAEVLHVSTAKKHAKAPVKVHYLGYDTSDDAWMSLDKLRSKHLPKAAALPAAQGKAKSQWDYTGLEIGMRVQAESDGKYFAAEVVALSEAPRRRQAPVKVHWVGYTSQSDEWVGGDRLRSKALKGAQQKRQRLKSLRAAKGGISALTWNIAAINNNPFEYWMTHTDERYAQLMEAFEQAIDKPELPINGAEVDISVSEVLTEALYGELRALMASEGWSGLEVVDQMWHEDFSKRKIVSGFLKDKALGSKRLASMPDRMTNTILVASSSEPICRPAVVNNFKDSLGSVTEWWTHWKDFMFCAQLSVSNKGQIQSKRPCELLGKISREKYPAITEEEEAVSLPLQVLCLAIFDAILVRLMNLIMPGAWLPIKQSIVKAIFQKKTTNTLRILRGVYADVDVICLQECALDFGNGDSLLKRYHKVAPCDADPDRAQNSLLLVSKKTFPDAKFVDLTAEALNGLEGVAKGDLVLVRTRTASGLELLLGSFHGDTNGLKSKPVVSAVASVLEKQEVKCHLIFGLDANTYLKKEEGWQSVEDFAAHCSDLGLRSCWPEEKSMADCCTTCHARTFLQTQFNKAIRKADLLTKGDVSPKDHIVIRSGDFDVKACNKDNTGRLSYQEQTPFPSLDFPSDHAVVSVLLAPRISAAS